MSSEACPLCLPTRPCPTRPRRFSSAFTPSGSPSQTRPVRHSPFARPLLVSPLVSIALCNNQRYFCVSHQHLHTDLATLRFVSVFLFFSHSIKIRRLEGNATWNRVRKTVQAAREASSKHVASAVVDLLSKRNEMKDTKALFNETFLPPVKGDEVRWC